MMTNTGAASVAERAIALILQKYGSLKDLPDEFRKVVWVTIYQACAIGLKLEQGGGPNAIAKSFLMDAGRETFDMGEAVRRMEFLEQMVPLVRSGNPRESAGNAQLVVDMLKWGILDAPDMSGIRRLAARKFAKADPMYGQPIPARLTA